MAKIAPRAALISPILKNRNIVLHQRIRNKILNEKLREEYKKDPSKKVFEELHLSDSKSVMQQVRVAVVQREV